MQELLFTFSPGGGCHPSSTGLILEDKIREFEMEMERLASRAENLRAQNDVLERTLQVGIVVTELGSPNFKAHC